MRAARLALATIIAALMIVSAQSTAANVYGYCQAPKAASFGGGFTAVPAGEPACHRGMFGTPGADGSLFEASTCSLGEQDANGDTATCTCLGVPQCSHGRECEFGCGCTLNATTGATVVNSYFSQNRKVTWAGTLFFYGGSATVECDNYVPNGQYLHGYTLRLAGEDGTFECEKEGFTGYSNWTCALDLSLSTTPLAAGDAFGQSFVITSAASVLQLSSYILLLVLAVQQLLQASV